MPATVTQHEICHRIDIHRLNTFRTAPGGMRTGGTQPDQIGAQAIDGGGETALADLLQGVVIQGNRRQSHTGTLATLAQFILLRLPALQKRLRVGIEGQAAADDFGALGRLPAQQPGGRCGRFWLW